MAEPAQAWGAPLPLPLPAAAPGAGGAALRSRGEPAGSSLSTLNVNATRLQLELESLLHPQGRNEQGKKEDDSLDEAVRKLGEYHKALDTMERLLGSERDPAQRSIWAKRASAYRTRLHDFSSALEAKRQRHTRRVLQAEQRSELFGDRDGAEVLNMLNDYQHESQSLNNASSIASQTIAQGLHILDNLREQGSTLRKAQDKLREIANVLGLSNSLLRVIDRTERMDRWIAYGGMLFTLLFLYFIYYMSGPAAPAPALAAASASAGSGGLAES
jgi:Golgi SNAP receptor complex protein 2